jgi:hypothetical protein
MSRGIYTQNLEHVDENLLTNWMETQPVTLKRVGFSATCAVNSNTALVMKGT